MPIPSTDAEDDQHRHRHQQTQHNQQQQHQLQQQQQPDDQQTQAQHPDNSGFEEVASVNRTRRTTTSIALPSSILNNAQTPDLRMYLAGQIARAACIYRIDEIVIYTEQADAAADDRAAGMTGGGHSGSRNHGGGRPPNEKYALQNPTAFFAMVLKYLETPQYLRKHLFPMSADLRLVGLLNPLALPSHVAKDETSRWREGVAYSRSSRSSRRHSQPQQQQQQQQQQHQQQQQQQQSGGDTATSGQGATTAPGAQPPPPQQQQAPPPTRYIDAGLDRLVEIDKSVPSGTRVTVDMSPSGPSYERAVGKYFFARLADRKTPPATDGTYWGYRVRTATALSDVFSNSVVAPQGYDLTVGTSERGTHISKSGRPTRSFALPDFSNLLIVFGGVHGLERSVHGDAKLEELGICSHAANGGSNVGDLFDFYLNTCPQQGSRTIRTEEAILISLAALQPFLNATES